MEEEQKKSEETQQPKVEETAPAEAAVEKKPVQRKASLIRKTFHFFGAGMWRLNVDRMGGFRAMWLHTVRFFTTAVKGFVKHDCALHSAGLTYFSILSCVPMLCLILLFAKTCGVGDLARNEINKQIENQISSIENGQKDVPFFLASDEKTREEKSNAAKEFGRQAREISNALFDRIDNFHSGTLGWVGLAMLLWTVVSTLGMVEVSFNQIWGVKKPRVIWKKCILYAFVSVVLPILVAAAMSLPIVERAREIFDAVSSVTGGRSIITIVTDFLKKYMGDGDMTLYAINIIFMVFKIIFTIFKVLFMLCFTTTAFAFFFKLMPNHKVRLRPALEGAFLTTLMLCTWMKLCAVAQVGIAKASALYGSFAFVPILLAWIYMSWQIILFGENMVYALQCVHAREEV